MKILRILGICLAFGFSVSLALGQTHRFPEHGMAGEPGPVPHAFAVGWSPLPNALGYQYVLSDNPLCFTGCSGDTREGFVTDTFAVEFNLQPDHWYYWITRVYLDDGDTTQWSLISSFFTESPENLPRILNVAPNPVQSDQLTVQLDWGLNPRAQKISLTLIDLEGNLVLEDEIRKGSNLLRFDEYMIDLSRISSGLYFLDVLVDGNRNNSNNTFVQKIIITK